MLVLAVSRWSLVKSKEIIHKKVPKKHQPYNQQFGYIEIDLNKL